MACVSWCEFDEIPTKDDPDSRLVTWEIELSQFTFYGWNQILKIFENDTPDIPTQFYIGAHSTVSDRQTIGTELSGDGYARIAVSFERVTDIKRWNTAQVTSPNATATWTVASFALWDAATAGNAWAFGNLAATLTVNSGQQIVFPDESVLIGGGAPPT